MKPNFAAMGYLSDVNEETLLFRFKLTTQFISSWYKKNRLRMPLLLSEHQKRTLVTTQVAKREVNLDHT